MAQDYGRDMRASAYRHLLAAEQLLSGPRKDVAGYLLGWAAECALKHMMQRAGIGELPSAQRQSDPYYAHFEALKTLLDDSLKGRRNEHLRKICQQTSLMQHWSTSMRYSDGKGIDGRWVDRWHGDAKQLVAMMDA